MLGRAVAAQLTAHEIETIESSRTQGLVFDAKRDSADWLLESSGLDGGDYVVNCIGLTKSHIKWGDSLSIESAVRLNVLFPIELSRAAAERGIRVIQVATDCVFSGLQGNYLESSSHDAEDVYGKTKSLGEIQGDNVMHLRCSLIGPESQGRKSLFFEWVRGLQQGSSVKGYKNHMWNGLTSQTFGKVIAGVIRTSFFAPGVHHLVPGDATTKFDLIRLELELLGRTDVLVEEFFTPKQINRTLSTEDYESNRSFFARAGYQHIPSIREMMGEFPWGELSESTN